MRRLVLGSLLGGLAMWLVGFIFWGPLLGWIPLSSLSDSSAQAVQQALATNLGPAGTGTYAIPSTATTSGTVLHANGPVAMVHYTNRGFPAFDSIAMIWGLVLAICCALIAGFAMRMVAGSLDFGERIRLVALLAVAVAGYTHIGQPVFNHTPYGYFVYLFISDVVTWIAAGAVLAWILPGPEPYETA